MSEPVVDITAPWVPVDTFGTRLAIVRQQLGGWNVKKAADLCGIDDQSWRNWEAGKGSPRDYNAVCQSITDATGVDITWLMVGGPLTPGFAGRTRCFAAVDVVHDQLELFDDIGGNAWNFRPELVLAAPPTRDLATIG